MFFMLASLTIWETVSIQVLKGFEKLLPTFGLKLNRKVEVLFEKTKALEYQDQQWHY